MLATDNGWLRPLQACKGDGGRMWLDKGKGGQVYGFWITYVVDHIESRACKSE